MNVTNKRTDCYRYGYKKAQSFLMYACLIGIVIGVLLTMQRYIGRSMQGLLKQNLDNMGGEKVSGKQYSPGRWFGSKSLVRVNTSGFDYEGRHGFGVNIANSQRSESVRITDTINPGDLPPVNLDTKSVLDGEDKRLIQDTYGSDFDPGINKVENNVNGGVRDWEYVSEKAPDSVGANADENFDQRTKNTFGEHIPESSTAGAVGESKGPNYEGEAGTNLPENKAQ
ncbi:MAG: hypothetical protein WCI77_05610 [Candidatus Omnitrophota bacterium]